MRILVFSAHPDDAEFSIGGTLLLLAQKHELTIAVMTDGSAGSYGDAETRKEEQECAAKMYGAELIWEAYPDCSLQHDNTTTMRVAQMIRDSEPDVILSPHWNQEGDVLEGKVHPEHRIMGELVRDGTRYARFNIKELDGKQHKTPHILWYMLNRPLDARLAIVVDQVQDQLMDLWKCHSTQTNLKGGKLIEHLTQERQRHATLYPGTAMIEFLDCDKPISQELLQTLLG